MDHNNDLVVENQRLAAENQKLISDNQKLTAEVLMLREQVRKLNNENMMQKVGNNPTSPLASPRSNTPPRTGTGPGFLPVSSFFCFFFFCFLFLFFLFVFFPCLFCRRLSVFAKLWPREERGDG
jgi:hypothetical protein